MPVETTMWTTVCGATRSPNVGLVSELPKAQSTCRVRHRARQSRLPKRASASAWFVPARSGTVTFAAFDFGGRMGRRGRTAAQPEPQPQTQAEPHRQTGHHAPGLDTSHVVIVSRNLLNRRGGVAHNLRAAWFGTGMASISIPRSDRQGGDGPDHPVLARAVVVPAIVTGDRDHCRRHAGQASASTDSSPHSLHPR